MTAKRRRPAPEGIGQAADDSLVFDYGEYAGKGLEDVYVPKLPDWRCKQAYPSALTPGQWAWEFLRRSIQYWSAWERRASNNGVEAHFGLRQLLDPQKRAAEIGEPPFVPWSVLVHRGPCKIDVWPGKAAIIVNRSLPLGPQLKQAARCIGAKGTLRPHFRKNPYRAYLRILDATMTGAKRGEIARVLYPDYDPKDARKLVEFQQKAAERLCHDGECLALPSMDAKTLGRQASGVRASPGR